ncbi:uncharacterized mitochondrial protein AtMg00810-like [Lathyrus oleraceus]|uniref:uncharacterized mitochondrial protein AtMg00810-like n=1 Tax=Pisum sativum TaxID=3888 RepID=UPI0021D353A9|nr:uncharacterized mitochondrial protein AtMg00810-like [Pisum sativum]
MKDELREIKKNNYWGLVKRSSKKPIDVKCVYKVKQRPNDDLLITSADETEIRSVKLKLMQEFKMSDLWNLSNFLGVEFKDTSERVFLHQKKYAQDILKRFKMSNCNATATPLETGAKLKKDTNDKVVSETLYKQIIGSLRYLCNTKPDICQSVGLLSRFVEKPQECHLIIVKRMLRYIKGTIDHGVMVPRKNKTNTDA